MSVTDEYLKNNEAYASTFTGPLPLPPVLGDPTINAADELAAFRAEERW